MYIIDYVEISKTIMCINNKSINILDKSRVIGMTLLIIEYFAVFKCIFKII